MAHQIKLQIALVFFLFLAACDSGDVLTKDNIWPQISKEHKPWTRWWWMGNAVTKGGIEAQLQALAEKGFGGVEITPIYGVKGYEGQYVDFLSEEWVDMLEFTITTANELHMGVDMNLGTGWPFGGPHLSLESASSRLLTEQYFLRKGQKLIERVVSKDPRQNPAFVSVLAVQAYLADGSIRDLMEFLNENMVLDWEAEQDCEIVAVFNGKTRQKVKRAAPGGAGWTLDHYSKVAFEKYASRFDSAFSKIAVRPRAYFNDSYEVYGSSGTLNILDEFKDRRGYDLRNHLRELRTKEKSKIAERIQADYRQTFAELLMDEFTIPWVDWSNNQQVLTKNQAHGSPGNIIDLYAAVDIPECETFGSSYFPIPGLRRDSADIRPVDPDPVMLKFATSAANVYGKKQVSSETFTWLAEHFKTSLSQCKPELEQVFLSGVNHVFYHGTTYSPPEAEWPGWLFYASVQFGPVNSFWAHVNGLNKYIARCQSILQSGTADSDVLVYWPYHDTRHNIGRLDQQISIHNIDEWLYPTEFYKLSTNLMDHGYLVDFATDRMIEEMEVKNGMLLVNESGGNYKTILLPSCNMMPLKTLRKLKQLAQDGAMIIFQDWPNNVPGFHNFEKRQNELLNEIKLISVEQASGVAKIGAGKIVFSRDAKGALEANDIRAEALSKTGLQFVRRRVDGDVYYYLVNHTPKKIDESLELNAIKKRVILMDPDHGHAGKVNARIENGKVMTRVQLESGQTIIIRCTDSEVSELSDWKYINRQGETITFDQPWKLSFLPAGKAGSHGGPEIPDSQQLDELISWTDLPDEKAPYFSGVGTYENEFTIENKEVIEYLLHLGKVGESAKVWINGKDAGMLWGFPYTLRIGDYVKEGKNTIQIEVANLMANRIRWMDQQGIEWRKFHEINFVNIDYEPFDASGWEPMKSGLIGPVEIFSIN